MKTNKKIWNARILVMDDFGRVHISINKKGRYTHAILPPSEVKKILEKYHNKKWWRR